MGISMSANRYWWSAAEEFTGCSADTTQGTRADAGGHDLVVIEVIEEFGAGRPKMCLSVADYVIASAPVRA
jgi:hypothetical protein